MTQPPNKDNKNTSLNSGPPFPRTSDALNCRCKNETSRLDFSQEEQWDFGGELPQMALWEWKEPAADADMSWNSLLEDAPGRAEAMGRSSDRPIVIRPFGKSRVL
ncbi:unnamed protein product [Periconia digitata]|uniref:Uncharacterized protein n=1 Tax=Periconia digitata TaxID=1303443 RepID=A0A9W4XR81_9PLEO|nr:unnamed protein product [Periconia digitata]